MGPENLCDDGFKIQERRNINTLAINSLRTAVKSYFTTYHTIMRYAIDVFENQGEEEDEEFYYTRNYVEMYSETIIHFQHFFELMLKDILRKKNELLALKVESKHDIFVKLALGNALESEQLENQKTVEFETAFNRVKALNKFDENSPYSFLSEQKNSEALIQLNKLRNSIWHRGSYVLRYKSLDLFIGKYILPIVVQLMKLEEYNKISLIWRGCKNRLNIDPVNELIVEASKEQPSIDKIAFLKELGRASFNNPLTGFGIFNDEIEERSRTIAEKELKNTFAQGSTLYICPCCGIKSLVGYNDTEFEYDDNVPILSFDFIYKVKCYCCNFELRNLGMRNLREYGFEDEPDYWLVTEY